MSIRAVRVDRDHDWFMRGRQRWAFELVTQDGEVLLFGRVRDVPDDGRLAAEGWFRRDELETRERNQSHEGPDPHARAELVIVELPRDVASALADAILTDASGTPAGDVRALRADLAHERARRDLLEDRAHQMALLAAGEPNRREAP